MFTVNTTTWTLAECSIAQVAARSVKNNKALRTGRDEDTYQHHVRIFICFRLVKSKKPIAEVKYCDMTDAYSTCSFTTYYWGVLGYHDGSLQ